MRLQRINHPDQYFDLYDGVFLLGSSEEDEISLSEEGVAPSHLQLVYAGDTVFLQSAKDRVYLDGKELKDFPKVMVPGQVFSLSEEVHFFLGDEEPPAAPILEQVQEPVDQVRAPLRLPTLKGSLPYLVGLAIFTVTVLGLLLLTPASRIVAVASTPTPTTVIAAPEIKTYLSDLLGKNLLRYHEQDEQIVLRVLRGSDAQLARWQEDIGRLSHKSSKEIVLNVVTAQELTDAVKTTLLAHFKASQITVNGLNVKVSGACLPATCALWRAKLEAIDYPDGEVIDNFYEVKGADFKIVSLTVSNFNATATLSRGQTTVVVPERGRVFDVGTLVLITQEGIEVATPGGRVFIPWNRS